MSDSSDLRLTRNETIDYMTAVDVDIPLIERRVLCGYLYDELREVYYDTGLFPDEVFAGELSSFGTRRLSPDELCDRTLARMRADGVVIDDAGTAVRAMLGAFAVVSDLHYSTGAFPDADVGAVSSS